MATLGEYIPNANTKLLLHLNGNSTDSSGNSNIGTDTSITYSQANGRFGQGAGFNGTSSKISYIKGANNYLLNNWTMIAWVKRGSPTSETIPIYQMGNCYFAFGGVSYWDGSGDRRISDSATPTDHTRFFCYVWTKSSTGGQKLYRDGVLVGTEASNTNNSNSYSEVNVGRFASPGNRWFNGAIDEFILENVVWTPAQIAKYYSMTKGRFGIV